MDCVEEVDTLQLGFDFNFSSVTVLDETLGGDCVCAVTLLTTLC